MNHKKGTLAYDIRSIELCITRENTGGIAADSALFESSIDNMMDIGLDDRTIRHIILMAIGRTKRFFNAEKQIELYRQG